MMDIFGIAVAFALIMTVLSVIVTSLSQATQAVLRMRGRNLKLGLATALSSGSISPDKTALDEAHEIMNRCDDSGLRRQGEVSSLWARFVGPAITWLDETTLREVLEKKTKEMAESSDEEISDDDIKDTIDGIVDRFGRLEKSLLNRYETRMRGVSLVWAVILAAVLQVSTPQLIQNLSTDPAQREAVLERVPAVLENPAFIADGNRDEESTPEEAYKKARARADAELAELARINITPWRYGDTFYSAYPANLTNVVGVLLTAILLTLGAPFWYEVMKTAVKWRDVFAPSKAGSAGTNGKDDKTDNQAEDGNT